MNRNLLVVSFSVILGAIIFCLGLLLNKIGFNFGGFGIFYCSLMVVIASFLLSIPSIFQKVRHVCCDYDWAEEVVNFYQAIPVKYRQGFWVSFMYINLAYLFYTINFMWGNADWAAVRSVVNHKEALAEGQFSAYWLQELLFDGKILPVINNLWAFAGLSLSGVLLAVYWGLPKKASPIVVCTLLFAVTPYMMGVLYYAKSFLGICWVPVFCLVALFLSQRSYEGFVKTCMANIGAILLFLIALGTYGQAVNFVVIAILGKFLIDTIADDKNISDVAFDKKQSVLNFGGAVVLYLLIYFVLVELQIVAGNVAFNFNNVASVLALAFKQMVVSLPFMGLFYKALYVVLLMLSIFAIIFNTTDIKKAGIAVAMLPLLFIFSVFGLFFVNSPNGEAIRAGFLGISFVYSLLFSIIYLKDEGYIRKITSVIVVLLIFMNFVRVAYIEKVWKFGFDAETKLAERIITRLEKMPEFNIDRQYKLLQIGEFSLRKKYYVANPGEEESGELLGKAYYTEGMASDAYNFFYQADFLSGDAADDALESSIIRDFILNKAQVWPAKDSLFIFGDYIVMVLDGEKLQNLRNYLSR